MCGMRSPFDWQCCWPPLRLTCSRTFTLNKFSLTKRRPIQLVRRNKSEFPTITFLSLTTGRKFLADVCCCCVGYLLPALYVEVFRYEEMCTNLFAYLYVHISIQIRIYLQVRDQVNFKKILPSASRNSYSLQSYHVKIVLN